MSSSPEYETEALIATLGEKHVIPILEATVGEPVPARHIIEEHDVPRTTFYRRIDRLEELNLVDEHGEVDLDGSHHTVYECNLDEIRIVAEDEGLETDVTLKRPVTERWIDAWDRIKEGRG